MAWNGNLWMNPVQNTNGGRHFYDGPGPARFTEITAEFFAGGYHHVNIGDIFLSRYRAIRTLGRGHFSLVWVCWDLVEDKFVALKIAKSAQTFTQSALTEILMLKSAVEGDPTDPHGERIVKLLDKFRIQGDNGIHIALVFELFGTNLHILNFENNYRGIPINNVRKVIRQVLEGLDYLHTKCKIIHTDIKPENILIRLDESYVSLFLNGGIDLTSQKSSATGPIEVTPSEQGMIPIPNPAFEECNFSVKIADLGNGCWTHKHFSVIIQTPAYRAVEVIIGAKYGTSADIWSTACTAFEMATGSYLFYPAPNPENHLAQMIELMGEIPAYVIAQASNKTVYFNEFNQLIRYKNIRPWNVETQLIQKYRWTPKDAKDFANFLNPMLDLDPQRRATAAQCLKHPWLNA